MCGARFLPALVRGLPTIYLLDSWCWIPLPCTSSKERSSGRFSLPPPLSLLGAFIVVVVLYNPCTRLPTTQSWVIFLQPLFLCVLSLSLHHQCLCLSPFRPLPPSSLSVAAGAQLVSSCTNTINYLLMTVLAYIYMADNTPQARRKIRHEKKKEM